MEFQKLCSHQIWFIWVESDSLLPRILFTRWYQVTLFYFNFLLFKCLVWSKCINQFTYFFCKPNWLICLLLLLTIVFLTILQKPPFMLLFVIQTGQLLLALTISLENLSFIFVIVKAHYWLKMCMLFLKLHFANTYFQAFLIFLMLNLIYNSSYFST